MSSARHALIVGGGIAGQVTALALQQAGIDATLYEAYGGPADGIGGMLTVAPNGLAALRIVGADDAVRAVGQPMTRTVIADGRGRAMGELSGLDGLPPSQAMWRAELNRALHDHAAAHDVRIEYGKRLIGASEDMGGVVTAHFADGTTASGDVLIGADGIRSTVRGLIDPHAPNPQHVPLLNFGGAAELAIEADPDATYFVFGRRAFLGYWVQPDGRTAWFSNLPHKDPMTMSQTRATPAAEWLQRLREVYSEDEPGRELLEHTSPDQLSAFGSVQIMPKLPFWHRGRMVLVGDSVHAPSPSSGQGASLAAESAIQLARCLRDLPVASALQAYERLRRDRVEKVAARAARTNESKTLGPVALTLMRLMMPVAVRTFLTPERLLGAEQRYRIDWDAPIVT